MLLKTVFSTGLLATLATAKHGGVENVKFSPNSHKHATRGGGWNPEDQSGDSQVYFHCDTHTYPDPGGAEGEGEGGSGISNSSLEVHLPDGTVLKPSASDCKQDRDRGVASYFQICTVNHPNLEAGHLIVHMFYLDIGSECSMNFSYRGQDYFVNNQQSPPTNSCGWSDGGFQAFGASLTDVCYFNIASHDPSDTTQGQGSVGTVSQSDLTPGATLSQGSTPTPLRRRTIV